MASISIRLSITHVIGKIPSTMGGMYSTIYFFIYLCIHSFIYFEELNVSLIITRIGLIFHYPLSPIPKPCLSLIRALFNNLLHSITELLKNPSEPDCRRYYSLQPNISTRITFEGFSGHHIPTDIPFFFFLLN